MADLENPGSLNVEEEATQVMTSVLAPGENSTEYQPLRANYLEGI